jgi:DNA-binding MarR family transcriptional regulator
MSDAVPREGANQYPRYTAGCQRRPVRNCLDRPERERYFVYEMISVNRCEDCIVFHLAKAYQRAHAHLRKRLAPYNLTPGQYLVREAIREEEGLSPTELGKRLVLDNATLSGVLDRLADRGWIVKAPDLDGKRFLRLRLPDKAWTAEAGLKREREEASTEILQDFSVEERLLLVRLLRDHRG